MGEERQFSTACGIPATNQPVWKRQNWCQTGMKTFKSHQHSMQNDTEQSPPLSQCRAGFSTDSEFSHSRPCLPHSHSLSSAFIWFLRIFPAPFFQTCGFKNAPEESIKGKAALWMLTFRRQSVFAPEYSRTFYGESALV